MHATRGSDRRTSKIPNGELQPQPSPRDTGHQENESPQPQPSPQDTRYIGRALAPSLELRNTTQPTQPTHPPIQSTPTSQSNSSASSKDQSPPKCSSPASSFSSPPSAQPPHLRRSCTLVPAVSSCLRLLASGRSAGPLVRRLLSSTLAPTTVFW
jgi:hypothetical protein